MTDYQKYINALRKCANEHENDKTFTGHIIVSDLCRDTANLLEELEQEPTTQERQAESDKFDAAFQDGYNNGYAQGRFDYEQEPTTKNNLGVDCISRKSIKQKLQEHHDFFVNAYGGFSNLPQNDKSRVDEITNCIAMVVNEPSVTPQEPIDYKTQYERFSKKADIVISQLRADRDRLEDFIDKIRAEIIEKDRNVKTVRSDSCCFFTAEEVLQIIDKYKAESEDGEAHPINENITKGFEEFTKMMFRQGQEESEVNDGNDGV